MNQTSQEIEEETCTHDSFTVWIVETRKQYYERNEYTGKLEETYSKAWESDWSTISCECDECGKSLDKEEIDRVYELKDFKTEKPVWKMRAKVIRRTDEIHFVFGDDIHEALKNLQQGKSHNHITYPITEDKPIFSCYEQELMK